MPVSDPPDPPFEPDPSGASPPAPTGPPDRREVLRDAAGVAVATGAYGLSFGAIALATGLDVWQTMALSVLMFTGASQFGLVAVVAGGGAPVAGAVTAVLLGVRNALYGLRLTEILRVTGPRRLLAAQLVIDESTAMAVARRDPRSARLGFWATGVGVFVLWNLGTLVGALGASWLAEPRVLGLDAAAPAAFLALLAPRLTGGHAWVVAALAAAVALLAVPFVPVGVPVLVAAVVGVLAAVIRRRTPGAAAGGSR